MSSLKSKLTFNRANAKLIKLEERTGKRVYSVSSLSGHSCIGANECLSMAIKTKLGLRIKDGPNNKFRCFSASAEAQYPNVYKARKHNFDIFKKHAKDYTALYNILSSSLPPDAKIIRFFVAGDMTTLKMFDAFISLAKKNPTVRFYQYTKSLPLLVARLGQLPSNYSIVASKGGKWDYLIDKHNLRFAEVVYSEKEAKEKGLQIDFDDYLACYGKKSFGLLIHGVGKKGSEQSRLHYQMKIAI